MGAAVPLGWLHADFGGFGAGPTLRLHRWVGTAASVCAVLGALLSEWDVRRGRRSLLFRVLLGAGAVLVGVAGHLGGTLVHGEDFFDWSQVDGRCSPPPLMGRPSTGPLLPTNRRATSRGCQPAE
jgi:hypothetical protein